MRRETNGGREGEDKWFEFMLKGHIYIEKLHGKRPQKCYVRIFVAWDTNFCTVIMNERVLYKSSIIHFCG